MKWIKAIDANQLWEGEKTRLCLGGTPILLMKVQGKVVGYEDRCPHLGMPLSDGTLEDCVLTCRAHGWQFRAETGQGINPEEEHLTALTIRISDNAVYVALETDSGGVE